jgi:hypothetical protein
MNEPDPLIRRLAIANPVPDQDVEGAGGSISATRILDRIVDDERPGSAGWMLSPDEVARLETASQIPLPSPYSFITRYTRPRTDG